MKIKMGIVIVVAAVGGIGMYLISKMRKTLPKLKIPIGKPRTAAMIESLPRVTPRVKTTIPTGVGANMLARLTAKTPEARRAIAKAYEAELNRKAAAKRAAKAAAKAKENPVRARARKMLEEMTARAKAKRAAKTRPLTKIEAIAIMAETEAKAVLSKIEAKAALIETYKVKKPAKVTAREWGIHLKKLRDAAGMITGTMTPKRAASIARWRRKRGLEPIKQ